MQLSTMACSRGRPGIREAAARLVGAALMGAHRASLASLSGAHTTQESSAHLEVGGAGLGQVQALPKHHFGMNDLRHAAAGPGVSVAVHLPWGGGSRQAGGRAARREGEAGSALSTRQGPRSVIPATHVHEASDYTRLHPPAFNTTLLPAEGVPPRHMRRPPAATALPAPRTSQHSVPKL